MAAGKTAFCHAYLKWAFECDVYDHAVILTPYKTTRDGFVTRKLDDERRILYVSDLKYDVRKDLVRPLESDSIAELREYLRTPKPGYAVVICDATARAFVQTGADQNERLIVIGDECHGHQAPAMRSWVNAIRSRGAKTISLTATPYRHDNVPVLPPPGTKGVRLGPVRTYTEQVRDGLAPDITLKCIPVACANAINDDERFQEMAAAIVANWSPDRKAMVQITPRAAGWSGREEDELNEVQKTFCNQFRCRIIEALQKAKIRCVDMTDFEEHDGCPQNYQEVLLAERKVRHFKDSKVDVFIGINNISLGVDWTLCNTVISTDFMSSLSRMVQFSGRGGRNKKDFLSYPNRYLDQMEFLVLTPVKRENEDAVRIREMARHAVLLSLTLSQLTLPAGLTGYTAIQRRLREIHAPKIATELRDHLGRRDHLTKVHANTVVVLSDQWGRIKVKNLRVLLLRQQRQQYPDETPEQRQHAVDAAIQELVSAQVDPGQIEKAVASIPLQEGTTLRYVFEELVKWFNDEYIDVRINPFLRNAREFVTEFYPDTCDNVFRRLRELQQEALDPTIVCDWAIAFYKEHDRWPEAGPIQEAPHVSWGDVNQALLHGTRGLPRLPNGLLQFLGEWAHNHKQVLRVFSRVFHDIHQDNSTETEWRPVLSALGIPGTDNIHEAFLQYDRARLSSRVYFGEREQAGFEAAMSHVVKHIQLFHFLRLFTKAFYSRQGSHWNFWWTIAEAQRHDTALTIRQLRNLASG
jgi:hypothetical protein